MRAARVLAVVRRHGYEARRNVDRVTDAFYWPIVDVLMWGFFSLSLAVFTHRPLTLGHTLIGAAIVWGVFRATQRDIASGFLTELWARNLANLLTTPLGLGEYLAGLLTITCAKAVAGTALAAFVAWAFYGLDFAARLAGLLPYILAVFLFAVAIGIMVAALVCRFGGRVQSLAWNLTGLLMPVSCVFYPAGVLPPALRAVALALPTTHAFDGVRAILAGSAAPAQALPVALWLDLGYGAAGLALFATAFRSARAAGTLVRAE